MAPVAEESGAWGGLVEAGNDEHVADFLLEGGPLSICNAFAAKRGYEGLAVVFEI